MRQFIVLLTLLIFISSCKHERRVGRGLDEAEMTYVVEEDPLYLINHNNIKNPEGFEKRVRWIASKLDIRPDWLMAVMHFESRFKTSIQNSKSGAAGLIQFTDIALTQLCNKYERCFTKSDVASMNADEQFNLTYLYLYDVFRSRGKPRTLADFYLCVFYPRKVNCGKGSIIAKFPSRTYRQNFSLDIDDDGNISVGDIHEIFKKRHGKVFKSKTDGRVLALPSNRNHGRSLMEEPWALYSDRGLPGSRIPKGSLRGAIWSWWTGRS